MAKKNIGSKIVNIIFTIIIILILYKTYGFYKNHDYNEFLKAEYNLGLTKFTKDSEVKYSKEDSYKVESNEFNDAIFYKTINVKPNTPYKLSCMVKTQDIQTENSKTNGGAQISIIDSVECSKSIQGTNDWQKIEFMFDSKNREQIEIGFRLGGNQTNAKGIAWFSEFELEEGIKEDSTTWNIACFILKNIDVELQETNEEIEISMKYSDIESIKTNMRKISRCLFKIVRQKNASRL